MRSELSVEQQEAETLRLLGLSPLQARVYLLLFVSGRTTVKALSKYANIARSDVYRTMLALQELGLVKKILSVPTMFEALPAEYSLPYLFDNKLKNTVELGEKTCNLIDVLNRKRQSKMETDDLVLFPSTKILHSEIIKLIKHTTKTIDIAVNSFEVYKYVLNEFYEHIRQALERGVKMRVILPNFKKIELLPEHNAFLDLFEHEESSLKYCNSKQSSVISIFDHKTALIPLASNGCPYDSQVLVSNSSSLVTVVETCFESLWNDAKQSSNKKRLK